MAHSIAHEASGQLQEASNYFHEILDIQKSTYPQNKSAISNTLTMIGNVYLQQGDTENVMFTFTEALRMLHMAGKSETDLAIRGFNLYGLSKLHPECAAMA